MAIHLSPGEKILIKTGRHRFIWYGKLGQIVTIFIFVLAIFILAFTFLPFESPMRGMLLLTLILFTLFLWAYTFTIWLDFHLDAWVITTERIIDTELLGLFRHEVSEFKLSRIQDISIDTHGIFANILNYGDIHIQTAGAARQFVFWQVPDPKTIKKVMLEAYDNYMVEHLTHKHDEAKSGL